MTIELLRSFLGWAAVCNVAFLCVIVFLFLGWREQISGIFAQGFNIPQETVNAVLFGALVCLELSIFVFFIMPYIALRFFIKM